MDKQTIDAAKWCNKLEGCQDCTMHKNCQTEEILNVWEIKAIAETAEYYEAKIKKFKDHLIFECLGSGTVFADEMLEKFEEIMEGEQ